jgi:hypothetical protein
MADRLKDVLGEATSWTPIVVLELMDNTSYFSSPAEGEILACEKGKDGFYHVSGELVVAPKELTNQTLRSILQVVAAAREHKTLLLTPLPRYLLTACCEREHHCTNFGDENYKVGQLEALVQQWKTTKEFLRYGAGKEAVVLNPIWTMGGEGRLPTLQLVELLEESWAEDEPVHMKKEAYFKLAAGILREARKPVNKPTGTKRAREEAPGPRRAAGNAEMPDCIPSPPTRAATASEAREP